VFLMIINDLNLVGNRFGLHKTNPVLVIDPHTVLSFSIAC
jgi:hypothetical protein